MIALDGLERLTGPDRPPIALALSGGGDSMALLHLAKAWADGARRTLIALTVDHGISPASADWSSFAAKSAARLGVAHRTLPWRGPKPATGLPAAARTARHALLADAARAIGARVILMAHTADDQRESALMRAAGSTLPSPRVWSPSPAWPAGRGVFLLRPLLCARRADLRLLLTRLGETWIDDPANDDLRFARARARRTLAGGPADGAPWSPSPLLPPEALSAVRAGLGGEFSLPRAALTTASSDDRRRLVAALALSAAGTARPPSRAALDRLVARLVFGDTTATLAGARVEARGHEVLFCREAGERARGGLEERELTPGDDVFDGRFLISTPTGGYRVAPLRGLAGRLPLAEQRALKALAPAVRAALPAVISPAGAISCPVLSPASDVCAAPLGYARLRAALGAIRNEAEAGCRIPTVGGVVARSEINTDPLN
ncbi:MAG TPA: tRNA lysidine(34) synthetase TilS [Caulobacteraceae bacterium]|nr:tRNA lysidine(34) synthetase TilS [Caulobacteraceae bacterium]